MQIHSKKSLNLALFIILIIVSTITVHALLQSTFWPTGSPLIETILDTITVLVASSPFLIIIFSQHRQLVRNEEKYRSLVQHNSAIICEFNLEGKLIGANSMLMEATGYKLEDLLNKSYKTFVIEEEVAVAEQFFEKAKKGELTNFELTIPHKSGRLIELGLKSVPIVIDHEMAGLFLIAKDITERKKSLEQLKLIKTQLESSEEKYRLIAENMSDYIALIDVDGKIRYASESHKHIDGFNNELSDFSYFHPNDQFKAQEFFNSIIKEKSSQFIELQTKHRQGYWMTLETSGKPILNSEGIVESVIFVSRDITERKKAEEILLKSEKLSVAGQLAAGVAHEIRNPLTTLRGFVQLMMTTSSDNHKYLEIMLSELDRINLIVGEFLILSRPHYRQSCIRDLRTIINHVIALLEPQAVLSNIRFVQEVTSENMFIDCEENHLKQVFINILKNAMEAMPEGGDIEIYVEKGRNRQAVIRFNDHGCGISAENIERLGEPFFTTKDKGTGLGMMITYKIIEDHKGKLAIQSTIGKGTSIEVLLPLSSELQASAS